MKLIWQVGCTVPRTENPGTCIIIVILVKNMPVRVTLLQEHLTWSVCDELLDDTGTLPQV